MTQDDNLVKSKPAWVPDWAWKAYREEPDCPGAHQLIGAAQMKPVWKAIERRASTEPYHLAVSLFTIVSWGLRFEGEARLGRGDRRKRSQVIVTAARELQGALEAAHVTGRAVMKVAQSEVRRAEARSSEAASWAFEEGQSLDMPSYVLGAYVAATRTAYEIAALLDALCEDAETWVDDATLQRPNGAGAARTYFVRELTRHFDVEYDAPLRAHVLAITSIFFDCERMTPADIAALAPVPPRASSGSVEDELKPEHPAWKPIHD